MKRFIISSVIVASLFVTSSVFAASGDTSSNVEKISVKVSKQTVNINEVFYISLGAWDAKWLAVSDAHPFIKVNPTFKASAGTFVNCATAEGVELCGKMDKDLSHVDSAYVIPITAKDQTGNVTFDVYVGKKMQSVSVNIWGDSVVSAQDVVPVEKVTATPAEIKSGKDISGMSYIIIGIIMLVAFLVTNRKSRGVNI